ncbi:MAG TPA: phosphoribosylformylglycinamidine synthase I [bacterium]|nr:phosphoribosylformylglycinamidine synthase I [bacterium]HPP29938.1 phosphoribosylformylglycinamidine synthase I [bacterium]
MVKPRVLILRVGGTNCDRETEWAFEIAGALPERVHINRIKEGNKKLNDYQVLVIPGGFSYGDDISAGKVLANEIRHNLKDEIKRFIEDKKPVIGICNGFQVLVKAGILPWNDKQDVSLGWNDSARFEDRWVYLKIEDTKSPFFKGLPPVIKLPVAHAEGKFIPESEDILKRIEVEKLIIFRYCDADGNLKGYPYNPNGSINNIAGISSPDGLIVGMMPHPERAVLRYYYPDWHREENREEEGYGFIFFRNIVKYFS